MSEPTTLVARIYRCPGQDLQAKVLDVLAEHGLDVEWADWMPVASGRLRLSGPYIRGKASDGAEDDLAAALADDARGCSFVVWKEPGEQLHHLRAFTPELGAYRGRWDGHAVVFTRDEITTALCDGDDLDEAMGEPWLADWARAAAAGRFCGFCGGPPHTDEAECRG
jgi:hypothetical protein